MVTLQPGWLIKSWLLKQLTYWLWNAAGGSKSEWVLQLCVSVRACLSARFFPWLKPLSLSAGPQIASLIWHVSHSQFPLLMHDSSALCSTGGCREGSTTACLFFLKCFLLLDESHLLCMYCELDQIPLLGIKREINHFWTGVKTIHPKLNCDNRAQ